MKLNQEANTLPALSLPRLSSKLENIADNLARFALEFGVADDQNFVPRLATIGFTNGVRLGLHDPKGAARFEELLAAESVPLPEELVGLTPALIAAFPGKADWTFEINCFLRQQWRRSADDVPGIAFGLETQLRILHGIRSGLVVTRESPATAQKIEEYTKTLWVENRFLSQCLYAWSYHDWEPFGPPFVEYTASCYDFGSVAQRVIRKAVAEIYPVARALTNPWSFSFWVQMGWNGGRNFAGHQPGECKALLTEAGPKGLQSCQQLYQRCVLGTARSDGEVQVEPATLRYIGEYADTDLARCYCTGREPRRLARVAFDFAFWMGIFASHPVPIIES
jgi:hypothetical protein